MKIAFLVNRADHASTRYRVLAFLPRLAEAGATWEVIEIPKGPVARFSLFAGLGRRDVIVVLRHLFGGPDLRFLRMRARRLVYDVDDALFLRDSKHDDPRSWTRRRRFRGMVRAADLVIAGNAFVAAEAARHGARAEVIPTAVDAARYAPPKAVDPRGATVGWIGSKSTLFYLADVVGALDAVRVRCPAARLRVIADLFPATARIPLEARRWSEATEVADVRGCDVGIMPLRDDPWSRGKCALKALQYMAAGLPVVVSPVGVNPEIVRDGIDGFWARDHAEWTDRVARLIEDPALRAKMGASGRARMVERYSVEALRDRWLAAIESAVEREEKPQTPSAGT